LAVVVGGGCWRWLLAVVVGGCCWRLLLAVVVVVRIVGILVRLRKNYCCYSKMSVFFLPLTRTDPKTSLTRMIVTLDTTIGFDKLVHVLKAENVVYSFIYIYT
jgi:hypothetical protein